MPAALDLEIRDYLARYVAGEISRTELEDWYVPASWNVHLSGNRLAEELVYAIDAILFQASSERWREDSIRKSLAPFVTHYSVERE